MDNFLLKDLKRPEESKKEPNNNNKQELEAKLAGFLFGRLAHVHKLKLLDLHFKFFLHSAKLTILVCLLSIILVRLRSG